MTKKIYNYSQKIYSSRPITRRSAYIVSNKNYPNASFIQKVQAGNTKGLRIIGVFAFFLLSFLVFTSFFAGTLKISAIQENKLGNDFTDISKISNIPKTASSFQFYIVQKNDNIWSICNKLALNCDQVKEQNNLQYPYNLAVGQQIKYIK